MWDDAAENTAVIDTRNTTVPQILESVTATSAQHGSPVIRAKSSDDGTDPQLPNSATFTNVRFVVALANWLIGSDDWKRVTSELRAGLEELADLMHPYNIGTKDGGIPIATHRMWSRWPSSNY